MEVVRHLKITKSFTCTNISWPVSNIENELAGLSIEAHMNHIAVFVCSDRSRRGYC